MTPLTDSPTPSGWPAYQSAASRCSRKLSRERRAAAADSAPATGTTGVGHGVAPDLSVSPVLFLAHVSLSSNDSCCAWRRLSLSLRGHCALVRCSPMKLGNPASGQRVTGSSTISARLGLR